MEPKFRKGSAVDFLKRGIEAVEANVELSFLSLRKHLNLQFWAIAVFAHIVAWGFEQFYAAPAVSSLPFRMAICILAFPLFLHPYPKNRFLREHQKSLFVIAATFSLPILFSWVGLANAALLNNSSQLSSAWLIEYALAIFFFLGMFSNPIYSLTLSFLALLLSSAVALLVFQPTTGAFAGTALFMVATIFTAYCFMLLTQHQMRYVHQKRILTAGAVGARVAHELRTPLLSISNFTKNAQSILYDQASPTPSELEQIRTNLKRIQKEVEFSNQTIGILLMSTKSAPFNINPAATFTASAAVETAIADYPFSNSAELKSIRYDGGQDFKGLAPEELVKHLIYNLVKNAFLSSLSYSNTTIRIGHEVQGGKGLLVVSDNGPGIPGNLKRKVFEDFYTTRVTGDGTGLGLSFCKSFMTQVGGDIEYERNDGHSFFVMRFPIEISQKEGSLRHKLIPPSTTYTNQP